MDWFKLHLSFIRGPEFMGSEPVDRATWVALLAYCADQENGGIIEDCAEWGDRRWMQTVGITKAEAHHNSDLWSWDGENLVIEGYDETSEKMVRRNRKNSRVAGKKGARKRWKSNPSKDVEACPDPMGYGMGSGLGDGMGLAMAEERRGEERRREESAPASEIPADQMEITPVADQDRPPPKAIGPTEVRIMFPALAISRDDPTQLQAIIALANEDLDRMREAYDAADRDDRGRCWGDALLLAWEMTSAPAPSHQPKPDPEEARARALFEEFGFERLYDASGVRGVGKVLTPETIVMGLGSMHREQLDEIESRLRSGQERAE